MSAGPGAGPSAGANTEVAVAKHVVRVVAGALFDAAGRVLIADRPPGKFMAGRWEFPGGKVAAGETESAALARELQEELGIETLAAHRSMALVHEYEDRTIELSMWIVEHYRGSPRSLDGQRLKWVAVGELAHEDMLPADRPFIEALLQSAAPIPSD